VNQVAKLLAGGWQKANIGAGQTQFQDFGSLWLG